MRLVPAPKVVVPAMVKEDAVVGEVGAADGVLFSPAGWVSGA